MWHKKNNQNIYFFSHHHFTSAPLNDLSWAESIQNSKANQTKLCTCKEYKYKSSTGDPALFIDSACCSWCEQENLGRGDICKYSPNLAVSAWSEGMWTLRVVGLYKSNSCANQPEQARCHRGERNRLCTGCSRGETTTKQQLFCLHQLT